MSRSSGHTPWSASGNPLGERTGAHPRWSASTGSAPCGYPARAPLACHLVAGALEPGVGAEPGVGLERLFEEGGCVAPEHGGERGHVVRGRAVPGAAATIDDIAVGVGCELGEEGFGV